MERSPFNRLPRELRDLIYEYAVVHEDGIRLTPLSYNYDYSVVKVITPHGSSKDATLALAMVCRQLYEETIGLYYARNRFYFPYEDSPYQLEYFIHSLTAEHRKQLTQVIFPIPRVRLSNKDGILGSDPLRRWKRVVDAIVMNARGALPGPITVRGRVKILNSHLDLVIDMNKVHESMEENIKAVENLQRRRGSHVWLRDLRDNMTDWLRNFDKSAVVRGNTNLNLYAVGEVQERIMEGVREDLPRKAAFSVS